MLYILCADERAYGRSSVVQGLVEALYNLVQAVLYSVIVYFMVGFDLNAGAPCLPIPSHKPCTICNGGISLLPTADSEEIR